MNLVSQQRISVCSSASQGHNSQNQKQILKTKQRRIHHTLTGENFMVKQNRQTQLGWEDRKTKGKEKEKMTL